MGTWLEDHYWLAGKLGDDHTPLNTARVTLRRWFPDEPGVVATLEEGMEFVIAEERKYGAATNVKPWKDANEKLQAEVEELRTVAKELRTLAKGLVEHGRARLSGEDYQEDPVWIALERWVEKL